MKKVHALVTAAAVFMLSGCYSESEMQQFQANCDAEKRQLLSDANKIQNQLQAQIDKLTKQTTEDGKKIEAENQRKHIAATMYQLCQQSPRTPFCFFSEAGEAAVKEGFTADSSIFLIGNIAFAVFWTIVITGIGWLFRFISEQKLRREVVEKVKELDSLKEQVTEAKRLDNLIPDLLHDFELLSNEKSKLQGEIGQAKCDLLNQEELAADALALRAEVTSLEELAAAKREEIDELTEEKTTLQAEIDELKNVLVVKRQEKNKADELAAFKAAFSQTK